LPAATTKRSTKAGDDVSEYRRKQKKNGKLQLLAGLNLSLHFPLLLKASLIEYHTHELRTELATKEEWTPILFSPDSEEF
jgi:hypothetical protein